MSKRFILKKIDKATNSEFKAFLRTVEPKETFYIRIDCWGGNSYIGSVMGGFIYFMKKYKSCRLVTEGVIAASAAFKIFIRGDERIITKHSIIQPHLPEPNKPGVSQETIAKQQNISLKMITSTIPGLTAEDIISYNNFNFPLDMMIKKGVVTKVVDRF